MTLGTARVILSSSRTSPLQYSPTAKARPVEARRSFEPAGVEMIHVLDGVQARSSTPVVPTYHLPQRSSSFADAGVGDVHVAAHQIKSKLPN